MSNNLFSWRTSIASSDLGSTTRHVLMTLSMHMNEWGKSCFPGTKRIAHETGLSERTVCTHLEVASKAGWIRKINAGFRGQRWRSNEYEASMPKGVKLVTYEEKYGIKPRSKGTEADSVASQKGTEPHAEATEPDDTKVLKEVQSSTSVSTSIEGEKKNRKSLPPAFVEMVTDLHAKILPELESVVIWDNKQTRARYLLKIWQDERLDTHSPEFWQAYFGYVRTNDWWMGRSNDASGKPFKASFEFLVHPKQFVRIVEACLNGEGA